MGGTAHGDRKMRDVVGYVMKHSYNHVFAGAAEMLRPYGLRPTVFSALTVICDNPELRQSQLAEILNIERSNMVKMVDQLEGLGYIDRCRVPGDRRSYALRATPRGQAVQKEAKARIKEDEMRTMANLSLAEREQLLSLLRKLVAPRSDGVPSSKPSASGGECHDDESLDDPGRN